MSGRGTDTRQRTALVGVRLTPDEHTAITAVAARRQCSPASVLRDAFFGRRHAMTRYHVLISDDLATATSQFPGGFRLIEPSGPGDDGQMRWWLCEDDNAPASLEQHRVEPVFGLDDDGRVEITERHIVNSAGRRVRS